MDFGGFDSVGNLFDVGSGHVASDVSAAGLDAGSSAATVIRSPKRGKSSSVLVKALYVGMGGFTAFDGWRRMSHAAASEEPSRTQSWVGALELLGGAAVIAHGLLR